MTDRRESAVIEHRMEALGKTVETIGDVLCGEVDFGGVPPYETDRAPIETYRGIECCRENDFDYHIVGSSELAFVEVVYTFDLVSELADELDDEQARTILGRADDEAVAAADAALVVVDSLTTDEVADLNFYLHDRLRSTDASYSTWVSDNDLIIGFEVHRKLFPDGDEFDPSAVEEAVRAVGAIGNGGRRLLSESFVLSISDEGDEQRWFAPPRWVQTAE